MENLFGSTPPLLSEDIIDKAQGMSTTLLSDAMGCFGGMDYTIKPVIPGKRMFGTAMTVRIRPGDNLFLHKAVTMGQKGYVLVVDGRGHTENAPLGELLATTANAVGFEGIVLDGVARDKDALCKLNFPIYCRGFIPTGPHKDGPGELNVSVTCGGVTVNPGDLVVGDDDGVVVVPRNKIEEVLAQAEKKLVYEKKRMQEILNGIIEPSWLKAKMEPFGF